MGPPPATYVAHSLQKHLARSQEGIAASASSTRVHSKVDFEVKEKDSAALAIAIARFSQASVFTVKGVSPKHQIVTQCRETYLERELIRAYLHIES